jgi:hypothetical protein
MLFSLLLSRNKKQSKIKPIDKTPSYIEGIMEKIERSENMEKNKQQPKKDASNETDRINKICAVIDEKLKEFGGSILDTENWIKANAKTVSDAYHAGFYLCQIQTQTRLYNWSDIMVFGVPGGAVEETEEPEDAFEVVPEDAGPVPVTPVTDTKKDAINDFLDEKKKTADVEAPEVA